MYKVSQKFLDNINKTLQESQDKIFDIFCKRIQKRFDDGADKNHPSVERELARVRSINGGELPEKIKKMVE